MARRYVFFGSPENIGDTGFEAVLPCSFFPVFFTKFLMEQPLPPDSERMFASGHSTRILVIQ